MTVEGAAGEGIDYLLDFGSNRITANKIGIIEDSAEEALGKQVLDEHLVDDIRADLWVKRCAAEFGKGIESCDELPIGLIFSLNDRQ